MVTGIALTNILEKLGGPKIAREDIEWIADIPAGRDLLDFLSTKTANDFALREIGLEKEEADLWKYVVQAKLVIEDPPALTAKTVEELPWVPLDYVTPSALRSQLCHMEEEQVLLDRQLRALDRRIELERNALSTEKQALKAISAAQDETSSSISRLKEQLSELCRQADLTISSAVQGASQLVNEYSGTDGEESCHHAYLHRAELSTLLGAFANIFSNLAQIRFEAESSDTLHEAGAVQAEAQRLASAIRVLEDKHVEIALADACERLEREGTFAVELEPVSAGGWVEAIIEQTWCKEQAGELQRRIHVLEQMADVLHNALLPPLALLYSSLSVSEMAIEGAYVAVQVLVDEQDDIVSDLKNSTPVAAKQPQTNSNTFDERVKSLLRRLHHLRSDAPSLVLTAHTDVLAALSAARAQHEQVLTVDIPALASKISTHLTQLQAPSHEYLACLTQHSPTRTRPLALPSRLQDQMSRAYASIATATMMLPPPEDLTRDGRTRRKLDAFVDNNVRAEIS